MVGKYPYPIVPTVLPWAEQCYMLDAHLVAFAYEVFCSRNELGVLRAAAYNEHFL